MASFYRSSLLLSKFTYFVNLAIILIHISYLFSQHLTCRCCLKWLLYPSFLIYFYYHQSSISSCHFIPGLVSLVSDGPHYSIYCHQTKITVMSQLVQKLYAQTSEKICFKYLLIFKVFIIWSHLTQFSWWLYSNNAKLILFSLASSLPTHKSSSSLPLGLTRGLFFSL